MDMEKKLLVVHRLHQILVPFMLRRQVRVYTQVPIKRTYMHLFGVVVSNLYSPCAKHHTI